MQVQQEFKEEVKYNFWKFLPYAIIVILLFLLFKSCLNGALPSNDKQRLDSLQNAYDSIEVENDALLNHSIALAFQLSEVTTKLDSMKSVAPKIVERWHKGKRDGRDSIVRHICDTVEVLKIYDSVVAKADSLHAIDSAIIRQHELKEAIMNDVIDNKTAIIRNRDKTISLKDVELNIKEEEFNKKIKKKNKTILTLVGTNVLTATVLGLLIFK